MQAGAAGRTHWRQQRRCLDTTTGTCTVCARGGVWCENAVRQQQQVLLMLLRPWLLRFYARSC